MSKTSIPTSTSPTDLRRSKGLLQAAEEKAIRESVPRGAKTRRIIGVDPGLASTGWGVIDFRNGKLQYIAHGCIETEAGSPRGGRLFFIHQSFLKILETYSPHESAMENLYFGKNISSAMTVSEARGVLYLALTQAGLPVLELTPNAIKQAVVGVARAEKIQIQEMVRVILGLNEIPKPDHAADALAAAICAAHEGGIPALARLDLEEGNTKKGRASRRPRRISRPAEK